MSLKFVPALLGAALMAGLLPAAAQAAGDAAHGAELFKSTCSKCHAGNADNGTGPGLGGVIGRKSGDAADYAYSRAMRRAALVWDDANLEAYLTDPAAKVPGNKMPASGLGTAQDRADVIAYLHTLK
jgi:cytochrome c